MIYIATNDANWIYEILQSFNPSYTQPSLIPLYQSKNGLLTHVCERMIQVGCKFFIKCQKKLSGDICKVTSMKIKIKKLHGVKFDQENETTC